MRRRPYLFFQTTLGTCRLIGLLRALQHEDPVILAENGRHALFATLPEEGHTIGVTIEADLFRRGGWDIDNHMGPCTQTLISAVAAIATPIVCFCASTDRVLRQHQERITALSKRARRPHCFVAVIITTLRPDVADLVGADGVLTDIDTSLAHLAELATVHEEPRRQMA